MCGRILIAASAISKKNNSQYDITCIEPTYGGKCDESKASGMPCNGITEKLNKINCDMIKMIEYRITMQSTTCPH